MVCKILFLLQSAFLCTVFSQTEPHQQQWTVFDCPQNCDCVYRFSERFQSQLRTVDCTNAGLHAFPENVPSDAQALVLRQNRLRSLFEKRVWLPDLLHLDVSQNRISFLGEQPGLFDGVYNLRSLDVSRNQLSNLNSGSFVGLFNLRELNLAENRIAHAADDAFNGLLKLETLKLSSNRLAYVQVVWWQHVRTLYDLSLDANYIGVLQADNFKSLSNLLSLDLSRNKIFRVNDDAFAGLQRLEILNLQANALTTINKIALQRLRTTLKSINLSRNPLAAVCTGDFRDMHQLKDVAFNGMPRLRVVEKNAFDNLPQLLVVEMHDNPYLAYIDAHAFVNAPQTTHLLLHNNNLTVLEREVVQSLHELQEISFYGNPLTCDCNARWLRELLDNTVDTSADTRISLAEADRLVCDGPAEHRFKLFAGLAPQDFGSSCLRVLSNMFDEENERKIGDDIVYRCRAVGVPKPRIYWTAPNGQRLPNAQDTLVVRRIKPDDAGSYVCHAENEVDSQTVSTQLTVADIKIRLAPVRVGSTSAVLTWQGADRENHVFQILFRRQADRQRQYAATVTPIMKAYTISNLQPNTDYEACITLMDDNEVVVNISCVTFATTNMVESAYRRIERTGNVAVGAALGIVASMLIVVCLAALALKRSRFTPECEAKNQDALCERAKSTDVISSIGFPSTDNLYSPLLISVSSNSLLRLEDETVSARVQRV